MLYNKINQFHIEIYNKNINKKYLKNINKNFNNIKILFTNYFKNIINYQII